MLISDLNRQIQARMDRVSATITWEDAEKPEGELYFATDSVFSDSLTCDPHAFLVAALLPAMRHGEKRIRIDGAICPQLKNGLLEAMAWIGQWYSCRGRQVIIESSNSVRYPRDNVSHHTASFLSGGIDSLATLYHSRDIYPKDHPRNIRTCLCIYGFDIGGQADGPPEHDYFNRTLDGLAPVVKAVGATLIPVYTNVRHLDDDSHFWTHRFHGAALASVAHAFSDRLSTVLIPSSDGLFDPISWGSHPSLDYNYGSADLQIVHDSIRFSRFDKLKAISQWDPAVRNLRVCTHNPSSGLNCGKCFKCVLAMTQLLAVHKLSDNRSFPQDDVKPELLERLRFTRSYQKMYFEDLIMPLTMLGRNDLVRVIKRKSMQYDLMFKFFDKYNLNEHVKSFDHRQLNGYIRKLYHHFLHR